MIFDYFPTKLALGHQFCNREEEKKFLENNIKQCRHTVLIAPRRYGKSSLLLNVAAEMKIPTTSVDLFLAYNDSAITKRILDGIAQIASQIMPLEQKVLTKLQTLFSKFRVSLGAQGFNLDSAFETAGLDFTDQVLSGLQALAQLAKEQNHKILFFIDEFQDIQEAANSKAIQGAIRHVAQESDNIVFVFSGSNRRLLLELFDDRSKPLYMICDMLHLERMSSRSYLPHLGKIAQKKWNADLPQIIFDKIMALTELHPYYINLLCHELWKQDHLPTHIDEVFACWQKCYETHEDRLISDLEKLTVKQQEVLKTLAAHPVVESTSHNFVKLAKTPSSTITQTIKVLLEKDMVYRIKKLDDAIPQLQLKQLRVLDPLLMYALKKYA
jgi:uncharacterized protein